MIWDFVAGLFYVKGPRWEKVHCPWNFFIFESQKCGCQSRNTMNGMGCTGEAGQTSKVGQFLTELNNTKFIAHVKKATLLVVFF